MLQKSAPLGVALALVLAPSGALAASGTPVKIRIEGQSKTLLAAKTIVVKTGSITKNHAPRGACPAKSAAGALDAATHHRWRGSWSTSFNDYLITSILGRRYGATANAYWEIFVNNVPATTGACEIKARRGQHLLFAVAPLADAAVYSLAITGAPRTASTGKAFTVKVVYYDAKGRRHALKGATITGADISSATTAGDGTATITPTKSGPLVLTASHGTTTKGTSKYGYVRGESGPIAVS